MDADSEAINERYYIGRERSGGRRSHVMSIIGSCGHKLTDKDGPAGMGWPVDVADYARDCSPAVKYMHVCTACRDSYESGGLLLKTEAEIEAYLRS